MAKEIYIRPHAEEQFKRELQVLKKEDKAPRPPNWYLSPQAIRTYILGGKTKGGIAISPKYFGQRRLIEIAIATLATDRALLLIGVPGTAKTWLSEHLSASICGTSTLLVQGTSGTGEDAIRYGWNYARLLQEGPSENALVASPVMRAMQEGKIARIEELTRIPSDVQDGLITILSEKSLPVAELNIAIRAVPGFSIIATANDRDKGIHELSSALQRRFNTVRLPLPSTLEEELAIVKYRVSQMGEKWTTPPKDLNTTDLKKLITVFRELRSGKSEDGEVKLKVPSATLSTAEAISAFTNSQVLSLYFSDRSIKPLAESIVSAVVKNAKQDEEILQEYLETIMKNRKGWQKLYTACKEIMDG